MLRQKDRAEVYKVAVNAALGSFLFGYELVNISSLQQFYQHVNSLTQSQTQVQISIITASLPLMAILGSALLKILVKHFKGRYLMIYMDILAILGMLIQDIRLSLFPLILGRMILGFVVGINSGLVAQYTFSVTPTTLSGSVGALRQIFLNVGVALGYALGFLIDKNNIEDSLNWRILLSFPIITCLIRAILLFTVLPYQIPLHRTKSKKIQHMQKYYYKIYENYALGVQPVSSPHPQITTQLKQPSLDQSFTKSSQKEKRNLIICIVLAASNQFCGINAIIFYAKQLFMRITNNNNNLSQLIIIFLGIIQIIATFIGGRMMDKWSKRNFLFAGQICMVFILAFIFIFNQNIGFVVTLIFMHSIAYSFSIGQLLLFYAAKMLDSTGYVVMANWFATFLVAISAQFMMKILGIGKMCLVFCVLLTICLAILLKTLPTDKQLLQRQASLLARASDNMTTTMTKSENSSKINPVQYYQEQKDTNMQQYSNQINQITKKYSVEHQQLKQNQQRNTENIGKYNQNDQIRQIQMKEYKIKILNISDSNIKQNYGSPAKLNQI